MESTHTANMETIYYNCSRENFINIALPHLAKKCPNLEFHFVFIDTRARQFENVCCKTAQIYPGDYDRVKIYGFTTRAIKECIDKLLTAGFVDRNTLIEF